MDSSFKYFKLHLQGRFRYQPGQVRAFGMIAGGSGITPMFQVVRAVLENPSDKTKVHLVYANVMGKVGPGGHPSAMETGTKFYISNLDYSISNDDIKVIDTFFLSLIANFG
ncbi:unnamed protein product [Lactuca saligna]|uniref:Oxidoreductase FAD/NAD(P)-binding domain-containing protein n=1 Tax=Lactuca saligna TaxID=75948 RepID=A0AA36A3W2_LACSI|nr:unnamed protein product [Lactuca saligna]